jgi:hypothetical protein
MKLAISMLVRVSLHEWYNLEHKLGHDDGIEAGLQGPVCDQSVQCSMPVRHWVAGKFSNSLGRKRVFVEVMSHSRELSKNRTPALWTQLH